MVNECLRKSYIPKRFREKQLTGLEYKTQKQREIMKAILSYVQVMVKKEAPSLILCGKPGTGKTHIGCALVRLACESWIQGEYVTTSNLMRYVKSTYNKDSEISEVQVLQDYGGVDFLVIDEVGVQFGSETEKLIFYEVINRRYENMLPTVLISNLTAEELKGFIGERAFDRFREDGGAILAFDWESHRGKE